MINRGPISSRGKFKFVVDGTGLDCFGVLRPSSFPGFTVIDKNGLTLVLKMRYQTFTSS